MMLNRRDCLKSLATVAATVRPLSAADLTLDNLPIVDTHQHLWDLEQLRLPWLNNAPEILNRSYSTEDYVRAADGLNIQQCVYLEVDVAEDQQVKEARSVIELAKDRSNLTSAAVISGRCDRPEFAEYIRQFADSPVIKGVRHLLQSQPQGLCVSAQFLQSVRLLGSLGMSFDMTIRPTELDDGHRMASACPDTLIVVDHCGVADPKAFMPAHRSEAAHEGDAWKKSMERLARLDNTVCKISGIVAHTPQQWSSEDLAPIVNHCLDVFGPDRVMFGGDWPVCLLGSTLQRWVLSLKEIVRARPLVEQQKLFSLNAIKHYRLSTI